MGVRAGGTWAVIGALGLLGACGGGAPPEAQTAEASPEDPAERTSTAPTPARAAGEAGTQTAETSPWLGRLEEQGMLTYEVTLAEGEPTEVRMLVQQRVRNGDGIAVRLTPIGTPLGEVPVYPQWLVGTPAGLSGLDEAASFTTPGFVPIDDSGQMRTEASSSQLWRVEARWLRAGAATSGTEAAVGWTLAERVGAIEQPVVARDCVRLERSDDTSTSTLLACAGLGVVERRDTAGDEVQAHWRLISIGERPQELE